MASLQLFWQLLPGHQHTLIWSRKIILSWKLLLYIYCHWYTWNLHCIIFVVPGFLLPWICTINSTWSSTSILNPARFGLGCNMQLFHVGFHSGPLWDGTLVLPRLYQWYGLCLQTIFVLLFADGTNIFHSNTDLETLTDNVNVELENIMKWLIANKLSRNFDKTHHMLLRGIAKIINNTCKVYMNSRLKTFINCSRAQFYQKGTKTKQNTPVSTTPTKP